jgi:hypothetical protein
MGATGMCTRNLLSIAECLNVATISYKCSLQMQAESIQIRMSRRARQTEGQVSIHGRATAKVQVWGANLQKFDWTKLGFSSW